MASPYPASFIDQNNEGRIVGEINFTDAGNQPGGGSPAVGFALHAAVTFSQSANGTAWVPDTTDFISGEWTYNAVTGEVTAGAGATNLYQLEASVILKIASGGPAEEVSCDITVNATDWNVDPVSFDLVPTTHMIAADTWRGSVAATLPLDDGCGISLFVNWFPFAGLTGEVWAGSYLRAFKVADYPPPA